MKFEITEGCYSKTLVINDEQYNSSKHNSKILEIISNNINQLNEHDMSKLIECLSEVNIISVEEHEYFDACEQCGSYGGYTKYVL